MTYIEFFMSFSVLANSYSEYEYRFKVVTIKNNTYIIIKISNVSFFIDKSFFKNFIKSPIIS